MREREREIDADREGEGGEGNGDSAGGFPLVKMIPDRGMRRGKHTLRDDIESL